MRFFRSVVIVSVLSLVAIGLVPAATAQVPMQTITSSGPLNNIFVGNELSCQISHVNDQAYEFYPPSVAPGDCGTLAFVDGTLFSPNFPARPTATGGLGTISPHTPVSQSAVTGAGTGASPFAVTTTVTAGPLQIVQVDSYVPGTEFYRTDIEVKNTAAGAKEVILYHALDCYLAGSDRGFGLLDQAARAPGCRESTNGQPGNRIEQLVPITGGNQYYEASFAAVWAWIGSHRAFNNTCECQVEQDNGIGVSWNLNLRAGATARRSLITTFSPTGQQALSLDKTADDPNVDPGAANGYTVSASNTNAGAVTLNSITDTLPQGFTYTPGSTTGMTTTDPTINGQTLTWTGPFSIPSTAASGGMVDVLHFGVTVSTANGIYFNEVSGDAGTFPVAPSGPAARVIVGGSACTVNGTPGNDTLNGTRGADVICGLGGNDRLNGGDGNDILLGGDGRDKLFGGDGSDILEGEGGNDDLNSDGGGGEMDGGPGDDNLFPWLGDETIRGGPGNDELDYTLAHRRLNIDVGAGRAVGMGTDRFSQIETVHGGQENDRIEGSNGNDRLFGAAGHDRVVGLGGNDTLIGDCIHSNCPRGQNGDDELVGGPGNDNFHGGGGRDLCVQNAGRETVRHLSCEIYRG